MTVTVLALDLLRLSGRLSVTPYTLRSGMTFLPASLCFGLHSTLRYNPFHLRPHPTQTRMLSQKLCRSHLNRFQPDGTRGHEHPDVRRRQEVHPARQPCPQRRLLAKAATVGEKKYLVQLK